MKVNGGDGDDKIDGKDRNDQILGKNGNDMIDGSNGNEVYLEGLSYLDGDDVEINQIHLGTEGENGPTVLSLCNEKEGKGHCREGPGLSVEGYLKEKDLKGPLKGSSLNELIKSIESRETYVYVQSRHHPEDEIKGQIYHN